MRLRSKLIGDPSGPIQLLLDRFDGVHGSGDGFEATCPAHDDAEPSLSIAEGTDGRALIHCHAGCRPEEVVEAIGLTMADLFPEAKPVRSKEKRSEPPITIEELARDKKLPIDFLMSLGLHDLPDGGVGIPYKDMNGETLHVKRRTALVAGKGSFWPKGVPLMAYGLERLGEARSAGFLVVVEGESDCWTLWQYGFPALGVPGAKANKVLSKEQFNDVGRIFVIEEPDEAGQSFVDGVIGRVKSVMDIRLNVVRLDDAKDPNDLHNRNPDDFKAAFQAALDAADPVTQRLLPEIMVTDRHLRDISSDAWKAIETANHPPFVFKRGQILVDIITDDIADMPVLRALYRPAFKGIVDRLADFMKETKEGISPARPPSDIVADMMATKELPLPTLLGITQAPIFSASGTLSTASGYQSETRHFFQLAHGVLIDSISEQVKEADLTRARSLVVDELLHDFPFVQYADLANAVAILLLPFVRLLIDGPTPLHLVESPTPGTGKGLLVDVLTTPMLGHGPPIMTEGRDEDEWRKRITAKLLQAPQFIFIDNVRSRLDSSALSAALTSPIWEDRVLGLSRTAVQPVTCVWIATANNPGLSLEVARRTVSIRLDRGVEKPWKEQDFKHPKLRDWARQHRGELIWSALTLVQAWIADGRPSGDAILGSYESYAEVIGGILQVAGVPGFLGNTDRVYAEADRETSEWVAFCTAWWDEFSDRPLGAHLLFGLATRQQLLLEAYGGRNDRSGRTRFGLALSKMRDRVVGEFRIRSADADSHTKTARYRLELRDVRDVAGRLGPHDSSLATGRSNRDEPEPSSRDALNQNFGGEKVPQPPATSRSKLGDIWEEEL